MYRKIILIITIALFPMLSIFINNKMDFYTPIVKCVKNIVLNTEDWNGKQEFSLLSSKSLITNVKLNNNNTIVIATFGQSNAANYGEGFYKPKGKVYQYYNGSVYDGSSPMLGATGGGILCGHIWENILV